MNYKEIKTKFKVSCGWYFLMILNLIITVKAYFFKSLNFYYFYMITYSNFN